MNWINIKSIAAIVAAAIAAGTSTHLVQQREANRLRNENQQLVTEQNKLTGERDAALASASTDKNEIARLQKNQIELLRLRGEVGLLRRQVKDLEGLQEQNRQLQVGLAKAGQTSEQNEAEAEADPQKQAAKTKVELAKELMLGFLQYAAAHNQDQYPTDLNQVLSEFDASDKERRIWAIKNDPVASAKLLNQFEIVIRGSKTNLANPDDTIAIREKEPWLLNGKRVKVYGWVDGHVDMRAEPPEGFEAWEKQRMIAPQPSR